MAELPPVSDRSPGRAEPLVVRGSSAEVEALRARIREAARTDRPLIVCGEPGSGRATVARVVQGTSRRALAPMVSIRTCGAAPEVTLREVFGYLRTAVPGATGARAGYVHSAAGGSLLLEAVPDVPLEVLDAVLEASASGRARMVGSADRQPFDLRLVLISELDAAAMVTAAEPWRSLPSRLPWLWIRVPPLRERPQDLGELMTGLLVRAADQLGRRAPTLSAEAAEVVASAPWPGNLVEMGATARALAARLEGGIVGVQDLPATVRRPQPGDRRTLAEVERDHVRAVLDRCGGNRSEAARRLGIDRKTLRAKLAPAGAP